MFIPQFMFCHTFCCGIIVKSGKFLLQKGQGTLNRGGSFILKNKAILDGKFEIFTYIRN